MSGIAGLYNVPSTQTELEQWSFAHAAHHIDINRAIYEKTGITLASYVLDPFDLNNPGVFLYQHQLMHEAQNGILEIKGYNLLDVNIKDQSEFAGWIWLVADEHYQAAQILGIG
ncbi:MAG: hypothetical protein KGL39_17235 [Patescibacteria group bacterium]|nr:hypothetical protein [Patescibacteria group bacterium]